MYDFSDLTILICDDDPGYRKYFKKLIEMRFLSTVVEFENPGDAFVYLENNVPDLIIMDMQMPVMDGFTAISQIRSDKRFEDVAIIACTALNNSTLVQSLISLRIKEFIVKPGNEGMIVNKLTKVLCAISDSQKSN